MSLTAMLAGGTLSRGDKGDKVFALQVALRSSGAELKPDGDFGSITQAAVKAFQAAKGLKPDGEVGPLTAAALDKVPTVAQPDPLPTALAVAPHLAVMRAITGTKETPGTKNNPTILSWATEIVAAYPDLKGGVGWYKTDATAWCGLAVAYCVAKAGYKPPLNPLWALNWSGDWKDGVKLKTPVLGAIGVMSRNGGGGAGAVGGSSPSGVSVVGGNGGNGIASSISGSSVTYAGGGGGGGRGGTNAGGTAGTGGGGTGGRADNSPAATAGTANTGGGGGGGGYNGSAFDGAAGGSGIVILRYLGAQRGTGGTVTSSGGYTIHTFTSSGTYTA